MEGMAWQMQRRNAAAAMLAVSLGAWRPGLVRAATVLRVLAWPGYADPDLVAVFEKRHGVKVEITTVASDDVLRAKLASPDGPGFDLVAANTAEIARLVDQKMLTPLPVSNMPNTARQLPRFRQLQSIAGITAGGEVYAMPFTYSEMGLVYDRQQFSAPPQSIAVLWDPRWQGKVLAFDGSSHGFSLAAMYRGLPPFRIDSARFSLLAKDLVALRRNVRSFYSLPEESVELFRKHKVAVMHANYGQQQLKQLRDAGLDVGTLAADSTGVVFGTSKGSLHTASKLLSDPNSYDTAGQWLSVWPNAAAAAIAQAYGSLGPTLAPVAACATGLAACLRGFELIRDGRCNVVLAGSSINCRVCCGCFNAGFSAAIVCASRVKVKI